MAFRSCGWTPVAAAILMAGVSGLLAGDTPTADSPPTKSTEDVFDQFLLPPHTRTAAAAEAQSDYAPAPAAAPSEAHPATGPGCLPCVPQAPSTQPPTPVPQPSTAPPSTLPPLSTTQPSPFDFSSGVGGQSLLASREIPAMIGDFFGGGMYQTITIQPPSFQFQGPPVNIQFQNGYLIRSFGYNSTGGDNTIYYSFDWNNHAIFLVNTADPSLSFPLNGITFTSTAPFSSHPASTGSPLSIPDPLTQPGTPQPGTFFTIDQNGSDYQNAATSDMLSRQPGLQEQKDDYVANNGPGTFVDSGPGSVQLGPGYAILAVEEDVPGGVPAQYHVQQVETFIPDDTTFTPDPITVNPPPMEIIIPTGNIAATPGMQVGRMKLTENTSPIPRDRVYINYSYFDNTPMFPGGVNVHRVTPGIEKTFFNGDMSIELRTPFATTLDSNINSGGITNTDSTQFGNLTTYFKALLWNNDSFAVAAGMGVAVPTADDVTLTDSLTGRRLVHVNNRSVHLLPFIGGAFLPNDRLFIQHILQFDIDANGNTVEASSFENGLPTGEMTRIGRGRDQTYMFLDISMGYWIYHGSSFMGITRLAPIFEYHLNQTLDHGSHIRGAAGNVVYDFGRPGTINLSNAVVGLTAVLHEEATLTLAYATPLGGSDQQFDGELRLMFNWYFGGQQPLRYGPALR